MKILAGGPTANLDTPLLEAHVRCLGAQSTPTLEVDIFHLDGTPPEGSIYHVDGTQHRWGEEAFDRVARLRQRMLDKAEAEGYDALFMVDDDILLGQGVLNALSQEPSPITYGAFQTDWGKGPSWQVWDEHPFGWGPNGARKKKALAKGNAVSVLGGGACTLIWSAAFGRARYHPRLQSLPHGTFWRGEDRTFNLSAEVHQLDQRAVGGLPIIHLYEESKRGPRAVVRALRRLGYQVG